MKMPCKIFASFYQNNVCFKSRYKNQIFPFSERCFNLLHTTCIGEFKDYFTAGCKFQTSLKRSPGSKQTMRHYEENYLRENNQTSPSLFCYMLSKSIN